MIFYLSPDGGLHALDDARYEHLLPPGSHQIDDAEFSARQAAATPPVPSAPEPTKAELLAQLQALTAKIQALP